MSATRALIVTASLGLCLAAAAEPVPPNPAQLKSVEKDLAKTEIERARAAAENAKAAQELEAARRASVALAKDIQDQEYSLSLLENRLAELEADAARQNAALQRRDAQMRQSLMALERLSLHPADALTFSPLTPDETVRAAILLRAAVPAISASASRLEGELSALYHLRAEIVDQKEQVAAGAAMLLSKRSKLDATIGSKAAQQAAAASRSQELAIRSAALAREAEDLRALFARLADEKAKRDVAEREAAQKAAERGKSEEKQAAEAAAKAGTSAPAPNRVVLKPPPGVAEAGPPRLFSKARGTLPFPAIGRITARYGEAPPGAPEGTLLSKGVTIATRPGATVVSPFDGTVAFAGPFRGYGELLIIEHTEGYHTLLAGLARIDAAAGQRVLAGEPVGVMSEDKAAALYVELRRDGQPINPLPWLAQRRADRETSSGPDRSGSADPAAPAPARSQKSSPG